MEEKIEQYTFGPEEKDILEKLNKVESSVEGYIQERYQRELIKTKYYSSNPPLEKTFPSSSTTIFSSILFSPFLFSFIQRK